MKYIITILMLWGVVFAQPCVPPTNVVVGTITSSSANFSFTPAIGYTTYAWDVHTPYPTPVVADFGTTSSSFFTATGLQPNTTYVFQILTICNLVVSTPDSVTFTTPSAGIVYTPMTAAGYAFKYLKADSGMALPVRDTLVGRGVNRGGLLVWKSASGMYVYNGSYWEKQGNKYFNFDNNFTVTQVADTFFVKLNSALTGPDRLIETGGIVLTDVNRVTVLDTIRYSQYGITKIADSAGFTVPFEPDGIFRSYALVIDFDGSVDTLRGVADSFALVNPDLRPGDILIGYVDVFGTSVQVTQSSANQRYSVRYIDPVSGLETGDSTAFKWDPAARTLSIGASNSTAQSATFLMNAARVALVASFNGLQVNVGSGTGSSGVMDVSKTILFTNRGTPLANFSAENDSTGYLRLRKGIGLKIDGLVNNSAEDSAITVDFTTKKMKMKKFAGGGSTATLQQSFDAAPTANPQINAHGNSFNIDSLGYSLLKGYSSDGINTAKVSIDGDADGPALINDRIDGAQIAIFAHKDQVELRASNFLTGFNNQFVLDSTKGYINSKFGVNENNPDSTLTVAGGIHINGLYYNASSSKRMLVIDTLTGGVAYQIIPTGGGSQWATSGADIYNTNSGNVGIGTATPIGLLDVDGGGSHDVVIHNLDEVEIQANDYTQIIGGGNEFDSAAAYVKLREDSVGIWPGWALSSSEIVLHGSAIDMWSQRNHVAPGASYFQQTDRGISMASSNDVYANLVITDNHIAFTSAAIGGANATFERGNMILSNGIYQIGNDGDSSVLQFNFPEIRLIDGGSLKADGNISLTGSTSVLNLKPYTVATLPSGNEGDYARVTDALAPAYGVAVVEGGDVGTPVFFTNGVWTAH